MYAPPFYTPYCTTSCLQLSSRQFISGFPQSRVVREPKQSFVGVNVVHPKRDGVQLVARAAPSPVTGARAPARSVVSETIARAIGEAGGKQLAAVVVSEPVSPTKGVHGGSGGTDSFAERGREISLVAPTMPGMPSDDGSGSTPGSTMSVSRGRWRPDGRASSWRSMIALSESAACASRA